MEHVPYLTALFILAIVTIYHMWKNQVLGGKLDDLQQQLDSSKVHSARLKEVIRAGDETIEEHRNRIVSLLRQLNRGSDDTPAGGN